MLLAIDAGNTNTVFAVYAGAQLRGKWRMATDERRTEDEYAVWLIELMRQQNLDFKAIKGVILSSVVPNTIFPLRLLGRRYFNLETLVIGDPAVKLGIEAKIDRPSEVGADRLVNAVGAYDLHGGPLIIVDFGTATTFDVVDDKGDYQGGVIAPGINLSMEALHRAAAKLPKVSIENPGKVLGKSTVSAMKSGIFFGYMGLIEGIVSRLKAEYGKPMKTIATGGLAALYSKHSSAIDHRDDNITMHGLRLIYERNQ
ncbi:MAG: type III pantothenate kinase [Alphaproteobacteria bacterium]|nr:type III pantothenate kinase [Alphaproteobacteria bacterium]